MHDPWTDRLSEYLDGDLAAAEREALEMHLRECLACRNALAGLQDVARATAALEDREPADDLWPGILGRIRDEAGARTPSPVSEPIPLGERRSRAARRVSFSVPQLLAAAVATMAISGTAVWLAMGPGREAAPARVAVQTGPVDPAGSFSAEGAVLVSSVDQAWGEAIDEMEQEFEARRAQLDPGTVRIVEENLRIIDDAIAEARAALARDPANGYLYRHLDKTMTKKLDLLRRAAGAALVST